MAGKKDKSARHDGIDVSGYMPPGGPVAPYPPVTGPGAPCCPPAPECKGGHKDGTLFIKLQSLVGQQVTVYVKEMGPITPVQGLTGGAAVVTGGGPVGLTGMLHNVGVDYIELHIMTNTMRIAYIPFVSISAVVPGGPLLANVEPNTVTTLPETI
ncbi:MAG: hypothetical protein ACOY31_01845 [Bacillota bacterium]